MVLLSKGTLEQSNTFYAQGGVSAVLAPEEAAPGDSVAAHIADTLAAGAGLNDPEAVRVLCTEAVRDIAGLGRYGVHFDAGSRRRPGPRAWKRHTRRRASCTPAGTRRAPASPAGSSPPSWNAPSWTAPATAGSGWRPARSSPDSCSPDDLAEAPDARRRRPDAGPGHRRRPTWPADGPGSWPPTPSCSPPAGPGRLFARTSNPAVATADGLALAWRAGAAVRDLEFFQFHPTTLAAEEIPGGPPALLISEAVRGEGAVLLDAAGYRFMPDYHPDAELAPRDVVSRSIALHLAATGAAPDSPVYLDARGIEAARGRGLPGPAVPDHHGGHPRRRLRLDHARRSRCPRPRTTGWAACAPTCGAAPPFPACTPPARSRAPGAQGANRLASNSLLEGLVFGRRAVEDFLRADPSHDTTAPRLHDRPASQAGREPGSCGPRPRAASP